MPELPHAPRDKPAVLRDSCQLRHLKNAIEPYVAKARATYPSARARYLKGLPPGHTFYVSTVLRDTLGHEETVFVRVDSITNGGILGLLRSPIQSVQGFRYGHPHFVREVDIQDWLIARPDGSEEGNVVGKFIDRYKPPLICSMATRGMPGTAGTSPITLTTFNSYAELDDYFRKAIADRNRRIEEGKKYLVEHQRLLKLACKPPNRISGIELKRYWKAKAKEDSSPAIIRGRIIDLDGNALPGALLSARERRYMGFSKSNGAYELRIPAKAVAADPVIEVEIYGPSYFKRFSYNIELRAGDSAAVDVRLCADYPRPMALPSAMMTGMVTVSSRHTEATNASKPQRGDYVKLHGDHFVVLNRRRLFTISIKDGELRPVSSIDAFAPGINTDSASYLDMFLVGDRIIVVGFNPKYGGKEVSTFSIDRNGNLGHIATYHISNRGDDSFYPNLSAQLIGTKLVLYSQVRFPDDTSGVRTGLPAIRKWHDGAKESEFEPILDPHRIYRPVEPQIPLEEGRLYTVTTCDVRRDDLACSAIAVIARAGNAFHASNTASYVWIGSTHSLDPNELNILYRFPLDGSALKALQLTDHRGSPYLVSEDDARYLKVLLAPKWIMPEGKPVTRDHDVAFLKIPMSLFGADMRGDAVTYRRLPLGAPLWDGSRLIGDIAVYAHPTARNAKGDITGSELVVADVATNDSARIPLDYEVDLIKDLGSEALMGGSRDNSVHFATVTLGNPFRVSSRYTLADTAQLEILPWTFDYKPGTRETGLLGGLVHNVDPSENTNRSYYSSAMVFLTRTKSGLSLAGRIAANEPAILKDNPDDPSFYWYDDSRPLFVRNRIFALLGYELVEVTFTEGRVREMRRINFQPH